MAFPVPDAPFVLWTDASLEGGFGAVLLQLQDGAFKVIAYASRSLEGHEKNYSAFLLEMAVAVYGIETFHVYLYRTPFVLEVDHHPMESLSTIHKRTLNHLQQLMNEYTFQICYKPGEENIIADALSRAPICALAGHEPETLRCKQAEDRFCAAVRNVLSGAPLADRDPFITGNLALIKKNCFIDEDDLVQMSRDGEAPKFVVPKVMRFELLSAAHALRFSGHGGVQKTLLRLQGHYWWPMMVREVEGFVQACEVCQRSKDPPHMHGNKEPLKPLPCPDAPNYHVHVDLMFPMASQSRNKYVLIITDAFSKLVELVVPNKEAETVACAIFNGWICCYSCPK